MGHYGKIKFIVLYVTIVVPMQLVRHNSIS